MLITTSCETHQSRSITSYHRFPSI